MRPLERLPHLDRAISLAPDRAPYYELRGSLRRFECQYEGALADYDRAIEVADRPYLRFRRGLVLCTLGRCRDALIDFDAAIAAQPENWQFYRGRSLARTALGDGAGALSDAQAAVGSPAPATFWIHARGAAYALLGHDKLALQDFDRALEHGPDRLYMYLDRADVLGRLGYEARAAADRDHVARRRGSRPCNDLLHRFHP